MDFSYKILKLLYQTLKEKGYVFYTFAEYLGAKPLKTPSIILRHDIETNYKNALHFAQMQQEMGIRGNYYFRILFKEYNASIIKQITDLGHEIGYHYDDLSYCKGDMHAAIKRFEKNLKTLRQIAPVKTICMEGAPTSKWDNRKLWNRYNYKDFGIIAEPYLDLNFNEIFYLSDTGKTWNGYDYIVRDKITHKIKEWQEKGYNYKSTNDIKIALENGSFPKQCMITFHPQRWHSKPLPWLKEYFGQKTKNVIKKYFYVDKEWK
ncbi:hypothetical protein ACFL6I_22435 [candidate division KSB1 bacterium]